MRKNEYILDFQIPTGATGPMGQPSLESVCFIQYASSTVVGNLSIEKQLLLPIDNHYNVIDSNVTVASGVYEITFCGVIDTNPNQNDILVQLKKESLGVVSDMVGMFGRWNGGTQNSYFSQTNVFQFENPQVLSVSVETQSSAVFSVNAVHLVIRKLPFSISECSKV